MTGLLLTAVLCAAPARAAHTLTITVVAESPTTDVSYAVATTWLGEARSLPLRDDGMAPDERRGDGVYAGQWSGDEVRALALVLTETRAGKSTEIWTGTQTLVAGEDSLFLAVAPSGPQRVRRSAAAMSPGGMELAESSSVAALMGWLGTLLLYGMWLVAGRSGGGGRSRRRR